MPCEEEKGLFPGRGPPGFGAPGLGAPGFGAEEAGVPDAGFCVEVSAAGVAGASASDAPGRDVSAAGSLAADLAAAGADCSGAGACGCSSARPADDGAGGFEPGLGPGVAAEPGFAPGLGAGVDAPVEAAGFSAAFSASGYAARSFLATGGSTVDDGDFTNSPISCNLARASFEVIPSSLASSCTRALATVLLVWPVRRPAAISRADISGSSDRAYECSQIRYGVAQAGIHWALIRRCSSGIHHFRSRFHLEPSGR